MQSSPSLRIIPTHRPPVGSPRKCGIQMVSIAAASARSLRCFREQGVVGAAVYPDGRVCISILHSAGDDPHGYETAAERWSPVQSVCSHIDWMSLVHEHWEAPV